jgi:hypothetical protein
MTDIAIRTEQLSKSFGSTEALVNLDLEVPAGEVIGYLAWPLLEPLEAGLPECRQILLASDVHPCHLEPLRGRLVGLGNHHGPAPVALALLAELRHVVGPPQTLERGDAILQTQLLLQGELQRVRQRVEGLDGVRVFGGRVGIPVPVDHHELHLGNANDLRRACGCLVQELSISGDRRGRHFLLLSWSMREPSGIASLPGCRSRLPGRGAVQPGDFGTLRRRRGRSGTRWRSTGQHQL